MKRGLILVALLSTCWIGCSSTTEPDQGSQTHFLASCVVSCPAPYECSCGVCTLTCAGNQTCAGQADGAACIDSACSDSATVCDVECTDDDACEQLGALFACEEGRCREPIMSEAGSGGASGTSGAGGTGGNVSSIDTICDGSSDMRLGLTSEGGAVEPTYDITNPYGHSFFFIDGMGRFYVSFNYADGIRTGTFEQAAQNELMRDFAWATIPELAAVPEVESCPDAGEASIWMPGYRASCTCGCDDSPLKAQKEAAFAALDMIMQSLNEDGVAELLSTPIVALAQELGPADGSEEMWPLDRAIKDIPGLVQDPFTGSPLEPVTLDDADEAAALRALRPLDEIAPLPRVQDDGVAYILFMRDAFPDGVEDKIDALRASSMAPSETDAGEALDCFDAEVLLVDWKSALDESVLECSDDADCAVVYPELRCTSPSVLIQQCPFAVAASSSELFEQGLDELAAELCPRFEEGCNRAGSCIAAMPDCVDSRCVMTE